jgi:hypothetical protein
MITVATMAAVEMGIVVTSAGKCHSLVTFVSAMFDFALRHPLIPVVDLEAPRRATMVTARRHPGHGGHHIGAGATATTAPETLRPSVFPGLIIDDTFPQTRRCRSQCHNVQSSETAPKPLTTTRVTDS